MPATSSGEVSRRTRITGRPAPAASSAARAVSATSPEAAPGTAPMPVASSRASRSLRDTFGSSTG